MYIGLAPDWLTDLLNDTTNVHQAKENKAVNISSNNRPAAAEI